MKLRQTISFLCAMILTVSLFPSAMAVQTSDETVIDLGDGFYAVETIEVLPSPRAGDTVHGSKTIRLYSDGVLIGTTYIGGVFDISGSTAKATSGNITGTGSNGWTYYHGYTSRSGNTVTGTATYQSSTGVTKSHSGSISCSPNGTLS